MRVTDALFVARASYAKVPMACTAVSTKTAVANGEASDGSIPWIKGKSPVIANFISKNL